MHSSLHIKQWYRRKGILYSDHPKKEGNNGKPLILGLANHKGLVDEGVNILKVVNDSISLDDPPFVLVGDVEVLQWKSFWYKVRCKIDGEIMLLCPIKGNLRINLENHLYGLVHTKCMEDLATSRKSMTTSTALNTSKRGRPTIRLRSTIGKQPDLYTWFTGAANGDSRTADESQSGMHSNSILALLCWGFWKKTIEYGGKLYRVDALLNDPKPRAL